MEEKRRRKLNIVDIVVIVLILAAAAFFGWKLLKGGDSAEEPAKPGVIRFVVEIDGLRADMYEEIAATLPCQMAASGQMVDGYVLESWANPSHVTVVRASSPINASLQLELDAEPGVEYVNGYFVCENDVDLNDKLNLTGSQEIRLGRSYYLKSIDFELNGTIISMEKREK
jgi:hypothetical protein